MIKNVLAAGLLCFCALGAHAQISASNTSSENSRAASPAFNEFEWYNVSGSFTLETGGKKYVFKSLKMRKIEGIKLELKGASPESASEFLFTVNTLDAQALFRPGLSYVSEGNLEHGETFLLTLETLPSTSVTTRENGGLMKVLSVRGGTVKVDLSGTFENSSPYTASFDLIDARYGR